MSGQQYRILFLHMARKKVVKKKENGTIANL